MFCPKCGTQLPDNAQFCSGCGVKIGNAATATPHINAIANTPEIGVVGANADTTAGISIATDTIIAGASEAAAVATKTAIFSKLVALITIVAVVLIAALCGAQMYSGSSGNISSITGQDFSDPSVKAPDSLELYTWDKLSAISAEIAKADSEEEVLSIAVSYNLVGPDGKLDGSQAKLVNIEDSQVPVRIIGFAHDNKSDGAGKAGITFQFVDCIAEHEMNMDPTNAGGWESSDMRAWLNGDMFTRLPEDLRAVIVPVDKRTNNVGKTKDIASVTTTSDALWLLSAHELFGDVNWHSGEVYNDIINAEGEEYKYFHDMNVVDYSVNNILVKCYNGSPCTWWERSSEPYYSGGYFQYISSGGRPYNGWGSGADDLYGVAPCFCV